MKIKGWDKISGYTYKGYCIVNPIHNADETKYMADVINLNLPHKPKWELNVLVPGHKWKAVNDDTFHIILWDEDKFSSRCEITKERMKSISIFRNQFEEMVDRVLTLQLTSAPSSHSLNTAYSSKTINSSLYTTLKINSGGNGILNTIASSGTNIVYNNTNSINTAFTQSEILKTIKDLQDQIDKLKNK